MTLATTAALVAAAVRERGAVVAFNVISLEHAEGIVAGLERSGVPGILQISENAIRFHGGRIAPVAAAIRELAQASSSSVSIHLDHVQDETLARDGIAEAEALGISSIMIDAAHLDYRDNVAATAAMAAEAHRASLWAEAELGEIGGKDGAHAPGVRTDPSEAAAFAAETGVDALAVAVGSSHAMTAATAQLDLALIGRLADAVPVPLVLHGSSGVPESDMREAVRRGIRKVNVGTALNVGYTRGVREALAADARVTDPRRYLAPARDAVAESAARYSAALAAG